MKFKQYINGTCDIEFEEHEIQIILKNKKIHLSDEMLKHFGNHLVKIVAEWHLKFNEKVANKLTKEDTEIEIK